MTVPLICLVIVVCATRAHKTPNFESGRSVIVNLFEWKWDDISLECENFLGPRGFGGVQVSPPNENIVLWNNNRPWWERYQPMSYKLVTRSGNEDEFRDMVCRCNHAGVRIYAEVVLNHMAGDNIENDGTAGSKANMEDWDYPAVPYKIDHFNMPQCSIEATDYLNKPANVRNCELGGLKDLNQTNEHVRNITISFLNKLIEFGVAGFGIDAAKHMWPSDLAVIYDSLNNLSTTYFPLFLRPYIYQEVIDFNDEAIKSSEYTPLGAVTEFKVGTELSNSFRGRNLLRWLRNWGPAWGFLAHNDAVTFVENHDNERSQQGDVRTGLALTYKEPRQYKGAIAFLLAHPYGEPQILSGYDSYNYDVGPPMFFDGSVKSPEFTENSCGVGWTCQHRWRQIYSMVAFRNAACDSGVRYWWDNNSNQIAFCRGNRAFIAFNNDYWDLNETLQTCLPPGNYCDIISGAKGGEDGCFGKKVIVQRDGRAHIFIGAAEFDMMLAIHVDPPPEVKKLVKANKSLASKNYEINTVLLLLYISISFR